MTQQIPPTDASAERRDRNRDRTFQWFKPKGRAASVYEDVTVDTQPSISRHMVRGWPLHFADGKGTWSLESTDLKAKDWYEFRDPREEWSRTFYQKSASYERTIEAALTSAREGDLFKDFHDEWIDLLRKDLQVLGFIEYGMWFPLAKAQRDCLSDVLAHCVGLEAAIKQRQAQAIVLYGMDLDDTFSGFAIEESKARFLEEGFWQPVRRYLERLASITDWAEVIVATNLCFEPIIGSCLRRDLLLRSAPSGGDHVTGEIVRPAELEWGWTKEWSLEFLRFAVQEESNSEENKKVISSWVNDWLPEAIEALSALEPLFARRPGGPEFEEVKSRVLRECLTPLKEADLSLARSLD